MNHCTYTAQGQIVCTMPKNSPIQELFVDEVGNDDLATRAKSSSSAQESAVQSTEKLIKSGSFCQATMYMDPTTKTVKVYNLMKDCPTEQQLNTQ